MTQARHPDGLHERERRRLAALADGRLTTEQRRELERRVAASPAVAGALARQRAAVAAVREAADGVTAPPRLRAWLAAELGAG